MELEKFSRIFSKLDSLGFDFDGKYKISLEEYTKKCASANKLAGSNKNEIGKTSLNKCPSYVAATISHLKDKHDNMRSQAAISKILLELGLQIIQRIPDIKLIKERRARAYEREDEIGLIKMTGFKYAPTYQLGLSHKKQTVYYSEWVGAAISDLATEIGTSRETVLVLCLIAAIATSEHWVPEKYKFRMLEELSAFCQWIGKLAREEA